MTPPATATGTAPARVNLIGEHIDYNGGHVLPATIALGTTVHVTERRDREVACRSTAPAFADAPARYHLGAEVRTGGWSDYVQAVTAVLEAEGHVLPGLDVVVTSTIPPGSGVSSSAALLVAMFRALRTLVSLPYDDLTIARLAHRAETTFVGAPVGVMDPMACSLGTPAEALLLDTRSLAFERVPLPSALELAVVDSGVPHRHASGGYRVRRTECEAAAALLDLTWLTDLGEARLEEAAPLPPPLDRRARHVVTEHARVGRMVEALRRGDLSGAGACVAASHASLRDDFEVSLPVIDRLVALASDDTDVYGARLTGGGFGGAVLLLCRSGCGLAAAERAVSALAREGPSEARVLLPSR